MDWTLLARGGALLLAGAVLVALQGVAHAAAPQPPVDSREALERLSRRRIYFGHQSVGGNVLEGVRRALAAAPGSGLRVVELGDPGAPLPPGSLVHGLVGDNGQPEAKLADFRRALEGGLGEQVDVALVKFCYVDIDAGTDVQALFGKYRAALAELKARHPRTTFVHVTAPLTVVQSGPRAWVKRLLGRAPWGYHDNVRREAFNALMRQTYAGSEPVFDLAALESTHPDGSRETYEVDGAVVPRLVEAYTDDGGHLNARGRARIAEGLVTFLASLPAPASAGQASQAATP